MIRALFVMSSLLMVQPAVQAADGYPCQWVRGRLSTYNGNPTFRIWPQGTRRLLGVVGEKPGETEDAAILPIAVRKADPGFERDIWGSFRVCPVTPERKGLMRMVRMVDARDLRVRER
ncbi:MAG: hypothetical protein J7496_00155 [Novosphingobium sp.]|nr:hypothetical protein [Novosphingobium sp.]